MKEYVKISVPVKDRLLFLITGLISKTYLINNTNSSQKIFVTKSCDNDLTEEEHDIVMECSLDIPFFDMDKGETKSNL